MGPAADDRCQRSSAEVSRGQQGSGGVGRPGALSPRWLSTEKASCSFNVVVLFFRGSSLILYPSLLTNDPHGALASFP